MPWLFGFMLFHVLPALGTIALSFFKWELPLSPRLTGLVNYVELASDPLFLRALGTTLTFALATTPASVLLGLGLALLLYQRSGGRRLLRSAFLLPAIVPGVATALTWAWMLNPRYGPLNQVLGWVGIEGPTWLYDRAWALPIVILIHLWTAGINMIVYLAALQNLPDELFDAAKIDGAGVWRRVRSLTLPLLSPVTLYLTIVNLIGSFQVFTPIYILTGGGPDNATLTLPLYIYLNGFAWGDLGYASAVSTALLLIVLSLAGVYYRVAGRRVSYAR